MEQFTFTLLLDYIYHRFAITFILCMIGIVIRLLMKNVNVKKKIGIGKVIASTMFSTFLMCAIGELIDFEFTVYVLVCVVVGMWSMAIVQVVMDSKFMTKLLNKYLKNLADPVAKSLSDALKEESDDVDESKPKEDTENKIEEQKKEKG